MPQNVNDWSVKDFKSTPEYHLIGQGAPADQSVSCVPDWGTLPTFSRSRPEMQAFHFSSMRPERASSV